MWVKSLKNFDCTLCPSGIGGIDELLAIHWDSFSIKQLSSRQDVFSNSTSDCIGLVIVLMFLEFGEILFFIKALLIIVVVFLIRSHIDYESWTMFTCISLFFCGGIFILVHTVYVKFCMASSVNFIFFVMITRPVFVFLKFKYQW